MTVEEKPRKVKAVGLATCHPQVIAVFNAHSVNSSDEIVMFPPRKEGAVFSIPPTEEHTYVLATAPDRLAELRKWSPHIYRLLVFGKPEDLQKLGVPIIDATVEEGKITKLPTMTVDEFRSKIENEAIPLSLKIKVPEPPPVKKPSKLPTKKVKDKPIPKPQEDDAASEPDPFLILRFRELQAKFTGNKVEFENLIMIPTLLRLAREIKRNDFKKACRAMIKKGVSSLESRRYRLFIEKKESFGYKLGVAVREYLGTPAADRPKILKLARSYDLSPLDVKLVLIGLKKFHAQM